MSKKVTKDKYADYIVKNTQNYYMFGHGYLCCGYGTFGDFGVLSMEYLKKKQRLGSKIVGTRNVVPNSNTMIIFDNVKEVDKMINRLETIKKEMIQNERGKK
jgi:hypothetical protein